MIISHDRPDVSYRLSKIPGARWRAQLRSYELPDTPYYAARVRSVLASAGAEVPDYIESLASRLRGPGHRADWTPPNDPSLPPMWRHQIDAVRYIMARDAAMLYWDMGCGKSRAIIETMKALDMRRVLIVCPRPVLHVWETEIDKYAPGLYTVVAPTGSVAKRLQSYKRAMESKRPCVLCVNYEVVRRKEVAKLLESYKYDLMVCDESHRIANHKASQTKACIRIGRNADRRVCLSGTPMRNHALNIYGQTLFLDPGIFGLSHFAFINRYGVTVQVAGRYQKVVGMRRQDEFAKICAWFIHRVRADEMLDLPDFVLEDRLVDLPPKARRYYREVTEQMISDIGGEDIVSAPNAAAVLNKAVQMASGQVLTDTGGVVEVHNEKIAAVLDILADLPDDEPVVVFCVYRASVDAIESAIRESTDRECYIMCGGRNDLAQWQADDSGSVLIVQIQSGSEGVSMVRARVAIYYTLPHSLAVYEQSAARLHRPGQSRSVVCVRLIARGTVDRRVAQSLDAKRDILEAVQRDIRSFISEH